MDRQTIEETVLPVEIEKLKVLRDEYELRKAEPARGVGDTVTSYNWRMSEFYRKVEGLGDEEALKEWTERLGDLPSKLEPPTEGGK